MSHCVYYYVVYCSVTNNFFNHFASVLLHSTSHPFRLSCKKRRTQWRINLSVSRDWRESLPWNCSLLVDTVHSILPLLLLSGVGCVTRFIDACWVLMADPCDFRVFLAAIFAINILVFVTLQYSGITSLFHHEYSRFCDSSVSTSFRSFPCHVTMYNSGRTALFIAVSQTFSFLPLNAPLSVRICLAMP